MEIRPTDEDAKAHGFESGAEWYRYSVGGGLMPPEQIESNYRRMLPPETPEPLPSGDMQWWQYLNGMKGDTERSQEEGDDGPSASGDHTYRLAEEFRVVHPYLFVDVEPYVREGICDLREDLSGVVRTLWKQDALGE